MPLFNRNSGLNRDGSYTKLTATGFGFDNCLDYDGVNDRTVLTNSVSFALNQSFTINMWIYPSAATLNMFFSSKTVNDMYLYYNSTTNIRFKLPAVGMNFTVPALNLAAWNMITVVRDVASIKVYVDGVASVSNHTDGEAWNLGLIGGYNPGTFPFAGRINETGIIKDVAASAAQITSLYNSGNGADFESILGSSERYFKYNGSGTDTVVVDSSSNSDNMTMTNFPASGMWIEYDAP